MLPYGFKTLTLTNVHENRCSIVHLKKAFTSENAINFMIFCKIFY